MEQLDVTARTAKGNNITAIMNQRRLPMVCSAMPAA
jgi:hypothetical protein